MTDKNTNSNQSLQESAEGNDEKELLEDLDVLIKELEQKLKEKESSED